MVRVDINTLEQRFSVRFHYRVQFTVDVFNPENPLLASVVQGEAGARQVLAVVDGGLVARQGELEERLRGYARRWSQALRLAAAPLVVAGGEGSIDDPSLPARLYGLIARLGLCRDACILAVGGGALLDLAGFVAATARCGIRCIRIPTTVSSQCDVGVRNGINGFGKQNFLGTFAPPFAVINDAYFLLTLDDRDWMAGVAEALRVALVRDAELFEQIETAAAALLARDLRVIRGLVHRCVGINLASIAGCDPFESGGSGPRDYSPWAAAKLEQLTGHRLRHGEAVAVGMALDTAYAHLSGVLPRRDLESIVGLLERLGFRLFVEELRDPRLFAGLEEYRQQRGGRLSLTLPAGIGRALEVQGADRGRYGAAIELLAARGRRSGP